MPYTPKKKPEDNRDIFDKIFEVVSTNPIAGAAVGGFLGNRIGRAFVGPKRKFVANPKNNAADNEIDKRLVDRDNKKRVGAMLVLTGYGAATGKAAVEDANNRKNRKKR